MTDYEKVLENVGKILPKLRAGGNLKKSFYGGIQMEEESK